MSLSAAPREIPFTLPHGYTDSAGVTHREGMMRLANANDELAPLVDRRVRENSSHLSVVILSLVITRLGTMGRPDPAVIESLFPAGCQTPSDSPHRSCRRERAQRTVMTTTQHFNGSLTLDHPEGGVVMGRSQDCPDSSWPPFKPRDQEGFPPGSKSKYKKAAWQADAWSPGNLLPGDASADNGWRQVDELYDASDSTDEI